MTVRDWLQLLIVPLALVVIGFLFTMQQDARQQQIEDQRAQHAQKIENQRAEAERELAEQRAQDEVLQAYLNQMSTLLLEKDLRNSEEDSEVRSLARARTLTVLERLDLSRKTAVMQFLLEASLVQSVDGRAPVIALSGADLNDVNLRYADLTGANLAASDLSDADLSDADLTGANLGNADLGNADLAAAILSDADLHSADLSGAFLPAVLSGANLTNADLLIANLSDADLTEANLSGADLRNADLHGADSQKLLGGGSGAELGNADLRDADLRYADLSDTVGLTEKQIEQAESLEGVTMPDRTIRAGRYVTAQFFHALSFSVSDGWRLSYQETGNTLSLDGPKGGELIFTSPSDVFDPSNLSTPRAVTAPNNPEEWASWLQRHPNLETSEVVPVSVGGVSGVRIDVTDTSIPDNYPRDYCGPPCVPLYPYGEGSIVSYVDAKDRFVIVDAEFDAVVIDVAAPRDKFDEFLPKAQKVLDSVEWSEVVGERVGV